MVEEQVLAHTQELARAKLEVEVVRDLGRFNAIAPEWDRLLDRGGADRVFLAHAWFRTWWEAFGAGNELHVVTLRSRGDLVAVAPMMRTRASLYGIRVDAIQSIYNPHTARFDFIVGNNQDPGLYEVIWRELAENADSEAIILTQVPYGSPTIPIFETLGRYDSWLTGQWMAPVSPFISLQGDYKRFFNTLKDSARENLMRRYHRLNRVAPVDVEVINDRVAVRKAMKDGLGVEAAAWKGDQGTAILSDPAVAEFYTRLAERQADLGQLRLTFLRAGGKRIAFNYVLQNRKRLYGIKIGYDPQYHSYSPGNMLLNLILQNACAERMEEYDFLGADDAWKFEWTKEKRDHRWLFLFRKRLRPRLLHYLKFSVVPTVKPGLKALCTYLPGQS